jgi:hypothetical protein
MLVVSRLVALALGVAVTLPGAEAAPHPDNNCAPVSSVGTLSRQSGYPQNVVRSDLSPIFAVPKL